MGFLFEILLNAIILILVARVMPKVEVKSFGSAVVVALLIGILNPTVGFLLRGVFHLLTLGIPLLIGLGFIIRLLVTAIIIKLVDVFVTGFKVHGFSASLILAVIMAVAGTILSWIF